MARITIIETGRVPSTYRERHGSFPDMFERMVRAEDPAATLDIVSIPNGDALPDPCGLEAILITGAAVGVYDGLDWIEPLEEFVGKAYANKTPMVGVCFGHQLIAQALGGTVRQSEKGWGIGRHVYRVLPDNGVVDGEQLAIAASHQDQLIEAPKDALTILSSDFTPHAGLLYVNGATLTVQPHPEFDVEFAEVCCELRDGKAPDEVVATAKASLSQPLDGAKLGGAITRFLAGRAAA
ncbi:MULTISPECIES: gamma-glutamyl-gamma-aminobutyrate hydrolase family protein [unclassified Bradyrhizobium]|uniref:glutamine amidotransferase-related protein n=1 Tax=unclassified Bradyrhizobium TaxID=2631580 RepID=UPI001FF955CD|nr:MULTISPECIES: gamma-glutamyl-gamma-aminobutyrate hydrolase family protein [unclassified Bradyrhizobium]MCK1712529.1 gamma-glutamyl-gamma-aminobutyrate hydrolase family protein [Bradyrhizobium sp. 143]MCK1726721.1 gamma-glutamyl-gamma-aminobutyrate hydrolase family protein [Bradyrhizobium sp. 142]